jgi:hypothetical protein
MASKLTSLMRRKPKAGDGPKTGWLIVGQTLPHKGGEILIDHAPEYQGVQSLPALHFEEPHDD